MKKMFLALLIIGLTLFLGSCAHVGDEISYINSQGYQIVDLVGSRYILVKDNKVYCAPMNTSLLKKNISKNIYFLEMTAIQPRSSFSINVK
jgi:hypothetical protein